MFPPGALTKLASKTSRDDLNDIRAILVATLTALETEDEEDDDDDQNDEEAEDSSTTMEEQRQQRIVQQEEEAILRLPATLRSAVFGDASATAHSLRGFLAEYRRSPEGGAFACLPINSGSGEEK